MRRNNYCRTLSADFVKQVGFGAKHPDLQSIAFRKIYLRKKVWDKKSSKKWLKKHNYEPIKKVHETKNFLRYRLKDPGSLGDMTSKE